MLNNIIIEKMDYKDILEVKKLENEQNINILSINSMKEDLNNENYMYFIAKKDSEIVGYIAISKVIDTVDILSIVVKDKYKKNGIATKLLQHIFKLDNIKKIMLEVRENNIPAQKLYEKLEFRNIYTRKNYYKDNHEDAYIYEKLV